MSFFKRAERRRRSRAGRVDLKARRPSDGVTEQITHWIASIQYVYGDPPERPEGAALESAGVQDRRVQTRNRSPARIPAVRATDPRAGGRGGREPDCARSPARARSPGLRDLVACRPCGCAANGRHASTRAFAWLRYSSEEVYRLYGFVGYQIDLQFEPGESFVGLGAGDIEGVSFVAEANHLFLKPKVREGRHEPHGADEQAPLPVRLCRRAASRPDPLIDEVILLGAVPSIPRSRRPRQLSGASSAQERLAKRCAQKARNIDYWFCGNPAVKA